ncbi:MAG: AAA family ATPase, partial [Selenomonadaceae bacterium]|nr:AAA family ATPase [Selenomonadaceae bacterium]
MLTTLTVENFALIENVAIEFGAGLNILTGETGAGKSILIDALGAVLGNRCGVNRIRKGADKLSIAATFSDGLRLMRTVSRTGKGSITANGKPITLAQLKNLCASLIDFPGQNKSLEILREENIYRLIDDEQIFSELKEYQQLYRALNSKIRELADKKSARADNLRRLEFLRWQ